MSREERPSNVLLRRLFAQERERFDGLDPADYTIRRTYAGRDQRAAGAWSWFIDPSPNGVAVGSHYPVGLLLRRGFRFTPNTISRWATDCTLDPK